MGTGVLVERGRCLSGVPGGVDGFGRTQSCRYRFDSDGVVKAETRKSLEKHVETRQEFSTGQVRTRTEVRTRAEADEANRVAIRVELVRMIVDCGIPVGRGDPEQQQRTGRNPGAQ